ncbi:hypothetical protein PFICI_11818 [Pestalotiopsis fici W106-1]|uniref:P-loop containing nucleoside triphosphate hydrolase protein n=1 Tax=Pestalotiopsis fici (strain W106-1 / CGMCC3.15140) TaxID=1229662 RepID=W3WUA1_PESFW|nr:uncharacterized protein PFICI_11818 [Pestalotiopsis fici W106-1]ETS76431.1 hypothetical protein PFICI_11818 [Pestalotiopsis fici W106-1]
MAWASVSLTLSIIPSFLIAATSVWLLVDNMWRWDSTQRLDDMRKLTIVFAGTVPGLCLVSTGGILTLRVLYSFSTGLLWVVFYPDLVSGPLFVNGLVPVLFFSDGLIGLSMAGYPVAEDEINGKTHPLSRPSSLLSYLTLAWLNNVLKKASRDVLQTPHVWQVDDFLSVSQSLAEIPNLLKASRVWPKPLPQNLFVLICCRFPFEIWVSGGLAAVYIILSIIQPFLVRWVLEERSLISIMTTFVAGILQTTCYSHSLLLTRILGMRIRSALTTLICDQIISRSMSQSSSAGDHEKSEASVLIEVDAMAVYNLTEHIHGTWVMPLQFLGGLGGLTLLLGWKSIMAGLGVSILFVPMTIASMSLVSKRMRQIMLAKDSRVSLVKEVLSYARHVKLYGWERLFEDNIRNARALEMGALAKMSLANAVIVFLTTLLPVAFISTAFISRIVIGLGLTSTVVFPALVLFGFVSQAMSMLPRMVIFYQAGVISYDRVSVFLSTTELDNDSEQHSLSDLSVAWSASINAVDLDIPIREGGYTKTLLRNSTMIAETGKLTVITGPVGSGKTSILRVILGEIQTRAGSVLVNGQIAYASQRPVLISRTIRENITFGRVYDPVWYRKVVDAACLTPDFSRLPKGDATMLGGTVSILSGGQQSRVAIARAVYSQRPLVVLDDPLAALDAKVQRSIVNNILGPRGILRGSTRVVSTFSMSLIAIADVVYTIEAETIKLCSPTAGQGSLGTLSAEEEVPNSHRAESPTEPLRVGRILTETVPISTEVLVGRLPVRVYAQTNATEITPLLPRDVASVAQPDEIDDKGISFHTYWTFLRTGKVWGWPLTLILAVVITLLNVRSVYCLQQVAQDFEMVDAASGLLTYTLTGISMSLVTATLIMVVFLACLMPASQSLHDQLTKGVLRSKLTFFDDSPLGQIVNRFTNDVNNIDGPVGGGFIRIVMLSVTVAASLVVVLTTSSISLLYMGPLALMFHFIQSVYRRAARQLRRLDNDARSSVLAMAVELGSAASIIRAHGQTEHFKRLIRSKVNQQISIWVPFLCLDIWLTLRVQCLSGVAQAMTAILLLKLHVSSSTLGLVLTFCVEITQALGAVVQTLANLEADLCSLDRILSYVDNPREEESDSCDTPSQFPSAWPKRPSITFDRFSAAYRPGGDLCLRNLNCHIAPGERVGVIGRTGAGKSSLMLALLMALDRDAVLPGGRILIDGKDLYRDVSATELRAKIALIPQEPVVFSGSLKMNLDPLQRKSDESLLDIVSKCRLVEILGIDDCDSPLDYHFADGSRRLSVGQTQILAMARAMVGKRNIVIIDEATASVDAQTAALAHEVMNSAFRGSTVIAIAHKIETVINYDKILVLEGGAIVEFDKPSTLLRDPESIFSALVRQSRASSSD